jgi:Cu/Ag efflux protein CusF
MRFKETIIAAATLAAMSGTATAGQKTVSKVEDMVKATATIQQIDSTSRMITFRNEDGSEDEVWAGPAVKRFQELKVGDKVTLTYYASRVYKVRRPGDPAPPKSESTTINARPGKTPGGTVANQSTDTVTVKSVNADTGVITVTTSHGHTVSRKVDDKSNLQGVKAGDTIDITYTQALLASVERAK